jgi:hypothetical protein
MSVATFFEKIMGLQEQRARTTIASYRELVAGVAKGVEPEPAEVERLLTDAGKSLDDLRQDVQRYEHRFALKAMVNSIPKWETERQEIDERIAAADRTLEAAEKQHEEVTAPLYASRRELNEAINNATRASNELVQTCDDDDLCREHAELDAEAKRLNEQQRQQTDRATYMEEKARSEHERAEGELTPGDIEARGEVAERYRKDAETARRDVKRLEKARADLGKRREQLEQQMRQA